MENSDITNNELMICLKLYLSPFEKKMIKKKSASIKELINFMSDLEFSDESFRLIFKKLENKNVLIPSETIGNSQYFIIDKKKLWDLINNNKLFKLCEEVIDEKYLVIS